MIVASRSPQAGGDQGAIPSMRPDNVPIPGAHFPVTTRSDTTDVHPKRIFADDPTVENRPATRFRLPARYLYDDDREDAHLGKDGTFVSVLSASTRASAVISEQGNANRQLQEIVVGSENPTFHHDHRYNLSQRDIARVPTLTSWTAAATVDSEQGHPPTWRRHFLNDTRRIPTAPSGQAIYTDMRSNNIARDRASSMSIHHEGLLSDMRSTYAAAGSLPQSMATIHHQQQRQGMRHMPPPLEMINNRSNAPYGGVLNTSRNLEVPINVKPMHVNHASNTLRTAPFNVSQNFVPETFRWRHPNGRIYEQVNEGGQPSIVPFERKSQLPRNSIQRESIPHTSISRGHQIPVMSTGINSISSLEGQPSDRATNLPQNTTMAMHGGREQVMLQQARQPQQPKPHQKDQQPTLPHSTQPPVFQKVKGFDKLDLLCTATLEIGELHDNPTGCSCPKSKCVALYCDCFKAGRRCHPNRCSCLDCKNTIAESGIDGARTKAIRNILARNPRAFNTAGMGNPLHKLPPGEVACNCVRSKCLKLYCSCFHHGKICRPDICTCVGCENTSADMNGNREAAIQHAIEKRSDAFVVKPKLIGQGCACKNNKCLRKYCECYRTGLQCNPNKCTCRDCENRTITTTNTTTINTNNNNSSTKHNYHAAANTCSIGSDPLPQVSDMAPI